MTKFWVDRDEQIKSIKKHFLDNDEKIKCIYLLGKSGIGKTYLAERIFEDISANNDIIILNLEFDSNIRTGSLPIASGLAKLLDDNQIISIKVKEFFKKVVIPSITTKFPYIGNILSEATKIFPDYSEWKLRKIIGEADYGILEIVKFLNFISKEYELYILIDDMQWMDDYTYKIIKTLINNRSTKMRILGTLRKENLSDNTTGMQCVSGLMKQTEWKEEEISLFDGKIIKQFLDLKHYNNKYCVTDIEKIFHITGGLPIYVSRICNSKETLEEFLSCDEVDVNFMNKIGNDEFKVSYLQKFIHFSEEQKEILFIVACNIEPIDKDVLFNVFKLVSENYSEKNLINELDFLIKKQEILRYDLGSIKFRHRLDFNFIYNSELYLIDINKIYYHEKIAKALLEHPDLYTNVELKKCLALQYEKLMKYEESAKFYKEAIFEYINRSLHMTAYSLSKSFFDRFRNDKIPVETLSFLKLFFLKSSCFMKDFKRCIFIEENLTYKEIQVLKENKLYAEFLNIVAIAYYYLNKPYDAISYYTKCLKEAEATNNRFMYYCSSISIAACYDLAGDYNPAKGFFTELSKKALNEQDKYHIAQVNMSIQMVSNSFSECTKKLEDSLDAFSEMGNEFLRNQACCANNLGLEYLMAGELIRAKEFLKQSVDLFNEEHGYEINFPYNNWGILYRYLGDLEKSQEYLHMAFQGAISPLQKAFSLTNLGITYFELKDFDGSGKYFKEAYDMSAGHIDPTVKSYTAYNFAYYLYRISEYDLAKKVVNDSLEIKWKNQLENLKIKRIALTEAIESKNRTITINYSPKKNERRKQFIKDCWEPAELMFFT